MTTAAITALLCAAAVLLSPAGSKIRWAPRAHGAEDVARRSTAPRAGSRLRGSDVPMMLDLIGAMLEAGSTVEQALTVLSDCCDEQTGRGLGTVVAALRLGADWEQAWAAGLAGSTAPELSTLERALSFGAATGAPSSSMLAAQAQQLRRRKYRQAERKAAALGVRLVIPLGLCSLPAFICLAVVPVLLALLPALG